jgi:pyoverdine/dityrosine biosynthesis protein Dit1
MKRDFDCAFRRAGSRLFLGSKTISAQKWAAWRMLPKDPVQFERPMMHHVKIASTFHSSDALQTSDVEAMASKILNRVFQFRRLLPDSGADAQTENLQRYVPHLPKLRSFIRRDQPVHFVLPAFPAKSPNRAKTISPLPDMGERLSLEFLENLCREIEFDYPPGAHITLCSDGRVFGDIVSVCDDDVSSYRDGLQRIFREIDAVHLRLFNLEDVYDIKHYDVMREELLIGYARSVRAIREDTLTNPAAQALFNGIHRFMFEDLQEARPDLSRNQCRERAKTLAYRVIQRSNAWSALVAERFPAALRLSIHPQPDVSEKIGIMLLQADDPWVTPWHSVALREGETFRLVKRSLAESRGARLSQSRDQLPFYLLP